jgi:hypothetical protein
MCREAHRKVALTCDGKVYYLGSAGRHPLSNYTDISPLQKKPAIAVLAPAIMLGGLGRAYPETHPDTAV